MEYIIGNKKTAGVIGEGGFSLLEVMIALVILGFGLLGTALMQVTAIQGNAFSMKVSEADALISAKIEEYKEMKFEDIKDDEKTVKIHPDDTMVYKLKTKVTDNTPMTGLKTVKVQVSWQDKGNHSTACETIISNS
ncbi:MAG: prepilin-type N-terminal cleavage/methylation domain-containing protein [Desulfococcaceae bacterium]